MYADMNKKDPGSVTVRLAIVDGLIYLGFNGGNAIAGPVKSNYGLKYNFALGVLFTVISAAYTIIFIKETLVKPKEGLAQEKQDDDMVEKDGNQNLNLVIFISMI